jgi:predicted ABC-type ATPase
LIQPQLVVIAGPNGAGKSTSAPALLPEGLPFINADDIANRLASDGDSKQIAAGRELLTEWSRLESEQADFAIETTLASISLAPRIGRLKEKGYQFHLIYFWLPNPEFAIERVAERVRLGGHNIPVETIRRRYNRGLSNFFNLYRPISETWAVYLNVETGNTELIATGGVNITDSIISGADWDHFNEQNPHSQRVKNPKGNNSQVF